MLEGNIALAEDQTNRERALALDSFIVEAPAGAGKTELLTQRFLKLLQTVSQPEEIIAITFTNKAAAEMRVRIIDSLLQAASGVQPEAPHKLITFHLSLAVIERSKQLGWALLENPARLRLYTIDGLCAALSRQMPLMSRFGAQPNVADDATQYYHAAVEKTLALIHDQDHQAVVIEALRYLDNDANKLTNLMVSMLAKRDQWMQYAQQQVAPEMLVSAFEQVVEETLRQIVQTLDAPFQNAIKPFAQHAAQHVGADHALRLLADWQHDLTPTVDAVPKWLALAELMLTNSGSLRKSVTKNHGFPTTDKETKQAFTELLTALQGQTAVEAALKQLRQLPDLQVGDQSWEMITTLSQLLNLAAAQLWLVFASAGEVDFIEVSQRAIGALSEHMGAPTALALRLDYQIQHILVDEFQDTSPSQIHLLESLTNGWEADDGRTLFLVGDPMQSIYRFRKAEVGLFLNAAAKGIGNVQLTPLRLYRNNRSCPAVIDWVNERFASAFPAQDIADQGAIHYRPFIPTREPETGEGVQICPIIQTPEQSLEAARLQEAKHIVEIVLKVRKDKPNAKIAILARARAHLTPIVATLRSDHAAIAFQAIKVEALNARQVIQDLFSLSSALLHRADRVNWLAILRAPWCGLRLDDLHALAGHDHQSTIWSLMQKEGLGLTADGQQRLNHVKQIFAEAFLHQGRQKISRWVYGVWLQLAGPTVLWKPEDSADVEAFFDCMADLERQQQFSMQRLQHEIDKLFAAPDPNGEQLQLMTIHQSKGLEFDTVIVAGMGNQPNQQDDQAIVLWETVPVNNENYHQQMALLAAPLVPKAYQSNAVTAYDYLKAREKQRVQHEDLRVLYVAATRAVRTLYLVGVVKENGDGLRSVNKHAYFGLLWTQLQDFIDGFEAPEYVADRIALDFSTFTPELIRAAHLSVPAQLTTHGSRQTRGQQAHGVKGSQDEKQLSASIGTLTHYYLEMLRNRQQVWSADEIVALRAPMQHWFLQEGFDADQSATGADKVSKLLNTTVASDDGQWLLHTYIDDRAELAMVTRVSGEVQRFVLDRTFIIEKGGQRTRWIVDYKTAHVEDNMTEVQLQTQAEQYRVQLEGYAALFAQENTVKQCAIFFVSNGRLVCLSSFI